MASRLFHLFFGPGIKLDRMKEVGVDISDFTSDSMADFSPKEFDVVISCCGCGSKLDGERQTWKEQAIFEDAWSTKQSVPSGILERIRKMMKRICMLIKNGPGALFYWFHNVAFGISKCRI